MLHRIVTLLVILWLALAICQPLCQQQGWQEMCQLGGIASRSLGYVMVRIGLVGLFCWSLIPSGGKG